MLKSIVVAWKKQAETCRDYLHKGSKVFVDGMFTSNTVDTDNGKRTYYSVAAYRVAFLDPPKKKPEPKQDDLPMDEPEKEEDDVPF